MNYTPYSSQPLPCHSFDCVDAIWPSRFAHALRDAVASEQYLCETEPNSDEGDGSISCGLKQKKSQLSRSRRLLTPRDLFWNALESSNCRIGQALRVKLEQLYLWTWKSHTIVKSFITFPYLFENFDHKITSFKILLLFIVSFWSQKDV